MAARPFAGLLWHLRRAAAKPPGEVSDGQLLERFLAEADETSFPELIRRHGPLVLGVCRRVLNDAHEAEDVFQATFLVLFRRAGSVDRNGSLAGWLYAVAYHLALRARAKSARSRPTAPESVDMPVPDALPEFHHRELRAVLDEELNRLPAKYRDPLVLCYLEGKTNAEAATQLGWPTGTVFTRLSRGRDMLRDRLKRRGVTLSAMALAAGLTAQAAKASVPATLAVSTLEAITVAAAGGGILAGTPAGMLAQEYLHRFLWRRIARLAAALVFVLAGTALATGLVHRNTDETKPESAEPAPAITSQVIGRYDSQVIGRHDGPIALIAISPDGDLIASASEDRTARIWSLSSGKEIHRLEGHRNMVGPVAFSPDGRRLATGSADREVVLWDAKTGKEIARSRGHYASVRCLAFSPDGTRLASGGEGASVVLHDAATAADLSRLVTKGTILRVLFFPGGSRLAASAGSHLELWDLESEPKATRLSGHGAAVQALLLTPDGRTLISGSEDGTIRFWDVAQGREVRRFAGDELGKVRGLALSPDGKLLVSAGTEPTILVWDLSRGLPIARLEGHSASVSSVAFTPDGKRLVSASRDHTLRLWNLETLAAGEKK